MLRVDELEAGMCLAANVMNRYSLLLSHGHKLQEKDISSLSRVLPDAYIQVIDPLLDQVVEFEDNTQAREVSRHVRHNISNVAQKVSQNIRTGVTLNAENIIGMQKVIKDMLNYLQSNPITTAIVEQSAGWDDYLQEHSANVFYLSMITGNTIRNYIKNERERLSAAKTLSHAMNLTPLATAALFHDIGMVPLERFYHKKEPLTDDEREQIRMHPTTGCEMLPEEIDPMVKLVVRCHHENHNGTGYPQSLPGDEINIFARIIRVADAFSAATADKVYCKARLPAQVLYEMLHSEYRHLYDPVVLRVFANIVQPFPVGAKIKLLSGKWAVVVRHNQKDPFKPHIVIAFDHLGDPLPSQDLRKTILLGRNQDTMIDSFGGQDMKFLNEPVLCSSSDSDDSADSICNDMIELIFP